jgi:hypothetical protein
MPGDDLQHGAAAAAARITQLSDSPASRLVQSTGNLYWTSNGEGFNGGSGVYRAPKSNTPGQEIQLYAEDYNPPQPEPNYGAITWAKVGDEYYGYFVVDYTPPNSSPTTSVIKVVPLSGGSAEVLVTAPALIGYTRDLVTDGSSLCWADAQGIRSVPVGGGPIRTLASGTTFVHLAMLGSTVYYPSGHTISPFSSEAILSVPATGGPATPVAAADPDTTVTAICVAAVRPETEFTARVGQPEPPTLDDVVVFWGQDNGVVKGSFRGTVTPYQETVPGLNVITVCWTGSRLLWSDTYPSTDGGSTPATLRMSIGDTNVILYSGASNFMTDLQGDSAAAYWADSFVWKYTF